VLASVDRAIPVLGASDDALKALDNIFKFKSSAIGIAQIALACKQIKP
jgi:hypothetical protein